jgi:hypothetical protein
MKVFYVLVKLTVLLTSEHGYPSSPFIHTQHIQTFAVERDCRDAKDSLGLIDNGTFACVTTWMK